MPLYHAVNMYFTELYLNVVFLSSQFTKIIHFPYTTLVTGEDEKSRLFFKTHSLRAKLR